MSQRPAVSIVTANYNGARFLGAAIRSVLDQTLADFELIIVDDASTDDSLAVAERAANGDPRVRVLVQPKNGGPAAARNRGLDAARGRWIAVFDSDDLMAEERLETLVALGDAEPADIVVDNMLVFGEAAAERPLLCGRVDDAQRWIGVAEYVAGGRIYARRPSLGYLKPLFRAEALGRARYSETLRIGEDYDLVLRLLLRGCAMRYDPRPLYRYRKHGNSISQLLRREHIEQMNAADVALAGDFARQPAAVRQAQQGRARSIERALIYDDVITALKARTVGRAVARCAVHPDVWPLLAMPVEARLRRLSRRLRPSSAPANPALA